jgi:restriction system protein
MGKLGALPDFHPIFIGRRKELDWLEERILGRANSFSPIIVSGAAGVGKTALVRSFFQTRRFDYNPIWISLTSGENPQIVIDNNLIELREKRELVENIVVLDDADYLSDKELEKACSKFFNMKRIRAVILILRKSIALRRAEMITLGPLDMAQMELIVRKLCSTYNLDHSKFEEVLEVSRGNPRNIWSLIDILKHGGVSDYNRILTGNIFNLSESISEGKIISVVKPTVLLANDNLIAKLKREPAGLYKITPRKFEELLADLLKDMGWDVELTKATRDGGKDILASQQTAVGRILCLVEAKRYREDRKIGIDLVRSLYGTYTDYQASCAMLVTSSSFSADAKKFQAKHEHQISLRDYFDVVKWIRGYGKK